MPIQARSPSTESNSSLSMPQITAVPPPMNSKQKEPVFFSTQSSGAGKAGSCFISEPERVPTRPAT